MTFDSGGPDASTDGASNRKWALRVRRGLARRLRSLASAVGAPAEAAHECPICGFHGHFRPAGAVILREDARCPSCRALERQRVLKLLFDARRNRFAGARLLHLAPEKVITDLVRPLCREYVTTDIDPRMGDIVLNIEDIALPDADVDAVICSHVLEHVDDAAALRELFRILRPGGFAILMVPLAGGWSRTYENPRIVTPEDRRLHFHQPDHLRYYGRDFVDRVKAAGFTVETFEIDGAQSIRFAIPFGTTAYFAEKPA